MPLAEAHRTGWAGFVVLATALGGMVACSGADRSGATPKEESPPEDEHVEYTEVREKCEHRNPLRNVYFGDLHVHTKLSFDAYYWRTRNTPEDAYRFAKGERVSLTSGPGEEDRSIQLSRPLDFAAGTDHAEFIGEVGLCDDPESSAYGTDVCRSLRRETESDSGFRMLTQELGLADPGRSEQVCGPEGERCERSSRSVWGRIQRAADRAYDRSSSCSFTSFVGYEYSNARDLNNLHRNVVFRNADVPDRVISTIDEPEPEGLWRALREECLRADSRCDVLAIPHNSNMSSGAMFTRSYPGADSRAERRELARLRARMEPLMELYQHKGSMECVNGLDGALGTPDEFCDFEKIYAEDTGSCGGEPGRFGLAGAGCRSPRNYYRNILAAGLKEKWELGVDPYRLGAIASTDTHSGTPGAVVESNWKGHMGSNESTARKRLAGAGTNTEPQTLPAAQSPGGLTGVWAVENARDAIFEALRRRETFGTSGPRITVRLFGGVELPDGMCDDPEYAKTGYEHGVPMGGELEAGAGAPMFSVLAHRDPGTESRPGTLLQQIQIVEGTVGPAGEASVEVHTVAGDPDNGASVDPDTCETTGQGFDTLCATWTDEEFDASKRHFYYARVLENPSCRWSTYQCNALEEGERPAVCDSREVPETIQERAWTSPIWVEPGAE